MRKLFSFLIITAIFTAFYGCRHISVGGSGQVGGVTGSGTVNIPLPEPRNTPR